MIRAAIAAFLLLINGLFSQSAEPAGIWTWQVEEKTNPSRLEAELRADAPLLLNQVTASVAGQKLPVQYTPFGQLEGAQMALLFLIDQSDPKRTRTIEAAKSLVLQLLDLGDARTEYAIYAFDSDLVPVADWGTPRDAMAGLLKPVKARGLATELYRNTMEAIAKFEKTGAARRVIVLLSDGKAEDTTYTLEQALLAARNSRTAVFTVGYAETPQDTVHLQSLRRLAAETGGLFGEADIRTKKPPQAFLDAFYPVLQSGGRAIVDLSGLQAGEVVAFELETTGRPVTKFDIPLKTLAPAKPDPVAEGKKQVEEVASSVQEMAKKLENLAAKNEETRLAGEAQRAEEIRLAGEAKKAAEVRRRRQTIVVTLLLAAAMVLVGGLFVYRTRRANLLAAAAGNAPIFARLQVLDSHGTEYLMRTTALRVGRGKDNDLALSNDSVSRHHAEISRARDGTFTITELNAGNGVLVNGETVSKTTLVHEDVIELGEVRIRFLTA